MDSLAYANLFKILSDETRLKVLQILTSQKRCACQFLSEFNISQSTLSHHMKMLVSCGLVEATKEGKWVYYSLNMETVHTLKLFFDQLDHVEEPIIGCAS